LPVDDDGTRQIPLKVLQSYKAFEEEQKDSGSVEEPEEGSDEAIVQEEIVVTTTTEKIVEAPTESDLQTEKETPTIKIEEIKDIKEEVARNDDIEIQIVRVTSNQDDSGLKEFEETTTETKSSVDSDGVETIETVITETTRIQGNENEAEDIIETVITTVIVKSDEHDDLKIDEDSTEAIITEE